MFPRRSHVNIWTDGSAWQGSGGWAALLVFPRSGRMLEVSGAVRSGATSQRMELTAALEGLRALKPSCQVALHSDSAYLINCFLDKWYENWYRKGWMTSGGKPVDNRDLWEQLFVVERCHWVDWVKVAGHAGVGMNDRVDVLARTARLEGYGHIATERRAG